MSATPLIGPHRSHSTSLRSALPRDVLGSCLLRMQPIPLTVMHTSFLSLILLALIAFTLTVLATLAVLHQALSPSPLLSAAHTLTLPLPLVVSPALCRTLPLLF